MFLRTQGNDLYLQKKISDQEKKPTDFMKSSIFKNFENKPFKLIYGHEYRDVFLVSKKDWNNYKKKPEGAKPLFYRRHTSNDKSGNYRLDVVFQPLE